MKVEFKLVGPSEETLAAIKNNAPNVRQAIRQTFFRMGRDLKKKTNDDILDKSTKTGRYYWVYRGKGGVRLKRRRLHRASAPLQTHANLTGALRESIGWKTKGTEELEFGYGLTRPAPEYAKDVEFGHRARNGTNVEKRPSLRNNIEKNQASFEKYFKEALEELEK